MFLKKSFCRSLFITSVLAVGFMACNKEEELDIETIPLHISNIEERFDAESNLYVRASITTTMPDTIVSVGFVYTDAREVETNPDPVIDHTLSLATNIEQDESAPHTYTFEGLIHPERESPTDCGDQICNYSNSRKIGIMPYVVSQSGKTYYAEPTFFFGDKLILVDLFPRHAAPGTVVKGIINRRFSEGKLFRWGWKLSEENFYFNPYLVIGDHQIPVEGDGSTDTFYFIMPDGLEEEADVSLRVEEYATAYDKKFKNTSRSFAFLNNYERSTVGGSLLFSSPGVIYLGGGKNTSGNLLTDFWKYTIATNQWSRIADYPSTGLPYGMAFTIGNNAYCGSPTTLFRYDITANAWSPVPLPANDLQNNLTFASASSVVYDGKTYFTNLSNKIVGGFYWKNFWQFDPVTETYTGLPDYTGSTIESAASTYLDKGVAYHDRLHFVRSLQHWSYYPMAMTWTQHADVSQDGKNMKIFGFHGELYGILTRMIPNGFLGTMGKVLTLYRYNDDTDAWTKDADVPRIVDGYDINPDSSDFYILQTSDDEVYFCQVGLGPNYFLYKIK